MEWIDVEFSVDLVQSAYNHLCFLDTVDNFEKILTAEVLRHSLKRYEQLWLPLAYENRSIAIEAPVDIHWLWYIHMLQPLAYRRDCRKAVQTVLDHRFKDEKKLINNTNATIELWYANYPKEGYNIIRNEEYVRPSRNKGHVDFEKPSKFSVDLISLAEAHIHFCYQVALPHFRNKKYIESAMKRYKQFLCLKRVEPNEFLIPSVDILLMWYTHMCNPSAYANDMMKICGKVFDNNIKVIPALINDRFILARDKTSELWKKVVGEDLVQPGTKLRSSVRRREVLPLTNEDIKSCCVIDYQICLSHVDIPDLPDTRASDLELTIYCVHKNNHFHEELMTMSGSKRIWSFTQMLQYNSVTHKNLRVVLNRGSRLWCIRGQRVVASADIDVKADIDKLGPMDRALNIKTDAIISDKSFSSKLILEGSVRSYSPIVCNLVLLPKDFVQERKSNKVLKRTLGQTGFPGTFQNEEDTCYSATHIMNNHDGEETFRCRITHIPDHLHSGVEIFFHQKLVATSHLIGSSQLPRPSQVDQNNISLAFDPELGERAMLIRNHNGDWSLCIARWMHDSGGGLEVRCMKLVGTGKVQQTEITKADIEFQSFNVNLFTGKILINPSSNVVAENLAVFWSICVLYVLCRPTNDDNTLEVTPTVRHLSTEGNQMEESHPIKIQDKSCQFLVAAGLMTETPCNDYMRKKFGSLTHDLLIDAQDVIVEEQKTSRKLLKHESIVSINSDYETSPVRKLKKKRSSKMSKRSPRDSEFFLGDTITEDVPLNNLDNNTEEKTKDNAKVGKRKRIRKRVSSKLEDMLSMSDDSITKDEVMESKLVKDEKGRKIIIKKISSNITDEIAPPEDSLDEEVKELQEFKGGLLIHEHDNEDSLSREGTTLIKEVVEKKKQEINRADALGVEDTSAVVREETSLIKDIAERKKKNEQETEVYKQSNDDNESKRSVSINSDGVENHKDENSSDVPSVKKETSSDMKKRIAKDRETKFPLSDEDINSVVSRRNKKKRKKSKERPDIPELVIIDRV
ncbi:hypothetical protein ACF0H5_015011 [Mactra antiquata]